MFDFIYTKASRVSRNAALLSFICAMAIYAVMQLGTIPKLRECSGGMELLDLLPFGYSADYAYSLFARLGAGGRQIYLCYQLPLDILYPGLFGIAICAGIAHLLHYLNTSGGLRWFTVLPLSAALFDYVENTMIFAQLMVFPRNVPLLAYICSVASVFKSLCTTTALTILILLLLAALRDLIRRYLQRQ